MNATYLKTFKRESAAMGFARLKNRALASRRVEFVVVCGPDDDFSVVDIRTAIDMGMGYKWSV